MEGSTLLLLLCVVVAALGIRLRLAVGTELSSSAKLLAGKFKPNVPKARATGAGKGAPEAAEPDAAPDAATGQEGHPVAAAAAVPTREKEGPKAQVLKHVPRW